MPTRDIHMRQIDMQDEWLDFLENYVQPLQEAAFMGYASEVGFAWFFIFIFQFFLFTTAARWPKTFIFD